MTGLPELASNLARRGRAGDNHLMHVSGSELRGLASLVPGGLTVNPSTGLPEAFKLKDVLPYAIPIASMAAAPFLGPLVGLSAPLMSGLMSGIGTAAATGDIGRGVSAGLMGYGGGSVLNSLANSGIGNAAAAASAVPGMTADPMAQAAAQFADMNAGLAGAGAEQAVHAAQVPTGPAAGGIDFFNRVGQGVMQPGGLRNATIGNFRRGLAPFFGGASGMMPRREPRKREEEDGFMSNPISTMGYRPYAEGGLVPNVTHIYDPNTFLQYSQRAYNPQGAVLPGVKYDPKQQSLPNIQPIAVPPPGFRPGFDVEWNFFPGRQISGDPRAIWDIYERAGLTPPGSTGPGGGGGDIGGPVGSQHPLYAALIQSIAGSKGDEGKALYQQYLQTGMTPQIAEALAFRLPRSTGDEGRALWQQVQSAGGLNAILGYGQPQGSAGLSGGFGAGDINLSGGSAGGGLLGLLNGQQGGYLGQLFNWAFSGGGQNPQNLNNLRNIVGQFGQGDWQQQMQQPVQQQPVQQPSRLRGKTYAAGGPISGYYVGNDINLNPMSSFMPVTTGAPDPMSTLTPEQIAILRRSGFSDAQISEMAATGSLPPGSRTMFWGDASDGNTMGPNTNDDTAFLSEVVHSIDNTLSNPTAAALTMGLGQLAMSAVPGFNTAMGLAARGSNMPNALDLAFGTGRGDPAAMMDKAAALGLEAFNRGESINDNVGSGGFNGIATNAAQHALSTAEAHAAQEMSGSGLGGDAGAATGPGSAAAAAAAGAAAAAEAAATGNDGSSGVAWRRGGAVRTRRNGRHYAAGGPIENEKAHLVEQAKAALLGGIHDPTPVLMAFVDVFGQEALEQLATQLQAEIGGGGAVSGPGNGMDDAIPAVINGQEPARLSDGEFVIPADVVSMLGDGSTDGGVKALEAMMDRVRQQKTGRKTQARPLNMEMLPA